MSFSTNFARALVPVAIVAYAAPARCGGIADLAKLKAHSTAVADDDREFRPDRRQGPVGGRNACS
jgi:hypothetical protein